MTLQDEIQKNAREHADRSQFSSDFPHDWNSENSGFISGANFILDKLRWRDPKEELPTAGEPVIVKYRTAKNVEKHGIGKYFDLGIGNPWIIEGSTSRNVIGWRPIE